MPFSDTKLGKILLYAIAIPMGLKSSADEACRPSNNTIDSFDPSGNCGGCRKTTGTSDRSFTFDPSEESGSAFRSVFGDDNN